MENQELQLRAHSTGLIAIVSDPEKAREFERGLTMNKIIETAKPIKEVMRFAGSRQVAQALDIALTKLVASVNITQNLNDSQIKIIVEDLLDKYPNETLEDFILVFKKARLGEFGIIYNLHSAVIFGWMEFYLEEKYALIERKLMNEKDQFNKPIQPVCEADRLAVWKAHIDSITVKSIAPLTEKEILLDGQEKPKREPYPTTSKAEFDKHNLHLEYLRNNYDVRTGEKLAGWLPENEWTQKQIDNLGIELNKK